MKFIAVKKKFTIFAIQKNNKTMGEPNFIKYENAEQRMKAIRNMVNLRKEWIERMNKIMQERYPQYVQTI